MAAVRRSRRGAVAQVGALPEGSKARRPVLQEAGHTFLEVRACQGSEHDVFAVPAGGDGVHGEVAVDLALDGGDRRRRAVDGDVAPVGHGFLDQDLGLAGPVHHAEGQRLVGQEHAARQQQVQRC